VPNSRGKKRKPSTKERSKALACDDAGFNSFLTGCLQWDPQHRFNPETAIQHEWILEVPAASILSCTLVGCCVRVVLYG